MVLLFRCIFLLHCSFHYLKYSVCSGCTLQFEKCLIKENLEIGSTLAWKESLKGISDYLMILYHWVMYQIGNE